MCVYKIIYKLRFQLINEQALYDVGIPKPFFTIN
jgi:hypothetical protein